MALHITRLLGIHMKTFNKQQQQRGKGDLKDSLWWQPTLGVLGETPHTNDRYSFLFFATQPCYSGKRSMTGLWMKIK